MVAQNGLEKHTWRGVDASFDALRPPVALSTFRSRLAVLTRRYATNTLPPRLRPSAASLCRPCYERPAQAFNDGKLSSSKGVASRYLDLPQAAKLGSVALTASEEADPYLVADQVISFPELDKGVLLPGRRGRQRVLLVSTTQRIGDRLSVSSSPGTTRSSWWISEFV